MAVTSGNELLSDKQVIELIEYHRQGVVNACSGGNIDWLAHEKIANHGSEYHRFAIEGELRGIFRRPSC